MSDFPLFPGFKTPPNDPSRDVTWKHDALSGRRLETRLTPPEEDQDDGDPFEEEECTYCDGWGYVDCYCGGDFCICRYNGEIPCYHCG